MRRRLRNSRLLGSRHLGSSAAPTALLGLTRSARNRTSRSGLVRRKGESLEHGRTCRDERGRLLPLLVLDNRQCLLDDWRRQRALDRQIGAPDHRIHRLGGHQLVALRHCLVDEHPTAPNARVPIVPCSNEMRVVTSHRSIGWPTNLLT